MCRRITSRPNGSRRIGCKAHKGWVEDCPWDFCACTITYPLFLVSILSHALYHMGWIGLAMELLRTVDKGWVGLSIRQFMGLLCMHHHMPVIPCVYSFPCTVPHGIDRTGHGTSEESRQRMSRTVRKTVHGTLCMYHHIPIISCVCPFPCTVHTWGAPVHRLPIRRLPIRQLPIR